MLIRGADFGNLRTENTETNTKIKNFMHVIYPVKLNDKMLITTLNLNKDKTSLKQQFAKTGS